MAGEYYMDRIMKIRWNCKRTAMNTSSQDRDFKESVNIYGVKLP